MRRLQRNDRPNLRLVDTVTGNYRVKSGDELLAEALRAYQIEADVIQDPAPIGVWLIHREGRRPQLCWEVGRGKKIKTKSVTISLSEAAEFPRRELARGKKRELLRKIQIIEGVLF